MLVNPLSGINRRKPVDTVRLSEKFSIPVREVKCREDIDRALAEFLQHDVNIIVISSGDGTVQALHSSIFGGKNYKTVPPIMVVPGGTTNMTAADVGVASSLSDVLVLLHSSGFHKEASLEVRDIIRLTVPGAGEHYGLFFATAGICDAMAWYKDHLEGRGLWGLPGIVFTFARALLQTLFSGRGGIISVRNIDVDIDGRERVSDNFFMFFITTLHRLMWGIRPFSNSERASDNMHLFALSNSAEGIAKEFVRAILRRRLSGYLTEKKGFYIREIRRAQLQLEGDVALDGEVYTASPDEGAVVVEIGGQCPFIRFEKG